VVHSSASWTGYKPHRPSTCSGASVWNESWCLLCPWQGSIYNTYCFFHCNIAYVISPQYYVICTLVVLLVWMFVFTDVIWWFYWYLTSFMIPEILQEFLNLSFTSFSTVNTGLCLLILQVNIQYILDPDFILWTRIITSSLWWAHLSKLSALLLHLKIEAHLASKHKFFIWENKQCSKFSAILYLHFLSFRTMAVKSPSHYITLFQFQCLSKIHRHSLYVWCERPLQFTGFLSMHNRLLSLSKHPDHLWGLPGLLFNEWAK